MKKKKIIIIVSILITPVLMLITARLLSWYTFYSIPTSNMEPTFKIGSRIFASSLLTPKTNDIISYNADPLIYDQTTESYIALCRIVGQENDEIEIKNGFLYVNKKLEDDTLNLCYNFLINYKSISVTPSKYDYDNRIFQYSDSMYVFNFSYNELKKNNLLNKCKRIIDTTTTYIQPKIFGEKYANKNWSNDNFGPVIVPSGQLFLLGDNRSNSADSRIRGFISKDKIIAKIVQ